MNIFYLDPDPAICARYHCDKHVVKMILESAQLLSTAIHDACPGMQGLYRPTHKSHPCAIWARQGRKNYEWLLNLTYWLGEEYRHRFGKTHKTVREVFSLLKEGLALLDSSNPFTEPPQCLPEQYRQASTVQAYREYYLHEKKRFAKYTDREYPAWLMESAPAKGKMHFQQESIAEAAKDGEIA